MLTFYQGLSMTCLHHSRPDPFDTCSQSKLKLTFKKVCQKILHGILYIEDQCYHYL